MNSVGCGLKNSSNSCLDILWSPLQSILLKTANTSEGLGLRRLILQNYSMWLNAKKPSLVGSNASIAASKLQSFYPHKFAFKTCRFD